MNNTNNIAPFIGIGLMILIVCVIIAFVLTVWGSIFSKADYSFWMCLLMLVPIANIVWILVFAFSKWPILAELEQYRAGRYPGQGFPVMPPPQQPQQQG